MAERKTFLVRLDPALHEALQRWADADLRSLNAQIEVPELIEAWKAGYRKAGALSREDEAEIPTFVMFRRLLLVAWIGSHSETELAKSMGQPYTEGTVSLCENYLSKFS